MNEPVNILLVDDEVRNLEVIESVLQSPDHRLVRAQTADEALMSLIRDEFAVIVLDIQMPVMSGLELAHLIKQRKRTQHIPIIFLTAYFQDDKDVMEGYGVGAVDYLNKPINPQILKSKVAVFVELFRKTRALQTINHALELEVAQRQKAEEALLKSNMELDSRVRSRTVELTAANDSLRASEQLYRAIGESINYGIWLCDPEGNNIYASESFLNLIGLTQREMSERGIKDVMHPEDYEATMTAWKQSCRTGTFWEREYRFRGKDGNWYPILSRGVPIRNEAGEIVRWAGIHLDIAAFKQTEKALRHQTRVLEILHRASVALVAERDIRKIAQCVTDAGVEISEAAFGAFYHPISMSDEKVLCTLSGPPPEIFLGVEGDNGEKVFWPTLNGVGIVRVADITTDARFKKVLKSGKAKRTLSLRSYLAVPVVSRNGEILGGLFFGHPEADVFSASCEDVLLALAAQTAIAMDNANLYLALQRELEQQKRTETALLQSQDRLSGALRAKDDFLAALSHELRTPLNPVLLLASESAEDKTLPEYVRANFESIRNYVEMEARLIDDLLDLTRITRGKLSLSMHVESVHTLVRNVIHILHAELEQKKIALELKFDQSDPQVMGDAVRLQQVFWNVLKNAVKFTPDGGRISVETRVDKDGGRVLTRVSDTGIGMTPAELKRIFGAFSQGDHASEGSSHRFGGIGLGLTISQMLVELQGGRIRAESQGRGQGATFEVELPLASGTTPKEPPPPAKTAVPVERPTRADGNKRRVLLVEDHEATRTALIYLLSRRGYEVVAAGSVQEGLEQAKNNQIHFLISDIGLPDGTGYDLMAKLGPQGLQGIALTGYGMEEDTVRSQKAGFALHLTKPVKVQALDQALASLKLD